MTHSNHHVTRNHQWRPHNGLPETRTSSRVVISSYHHKTTGSFQSPDNGSLEIKARVEAMQNHHQAQRQNQGMQDRREAPRQNPATQTHREVHLCRLFPIPNRLLPNQPQVPQARKRSTKNHREALRHCPVIALSQQLRNRPLVKSRRRKRRPRRSGREDEEPGEDLRRETRPAASRRTSHRAHSLSLATETGTRSHRRVGAALPLGAGKIGDTSGHRQLGVDLTRPTGMTRAPVQPKRSEALGSKAGTVLSR